MARIVDVGLPCGERSWHHLVRLHRAERAALVNDDDQVLLLWRHRFVQDRWGWELAGGLIDEGEEPMETATRELEEETAIAPDAWSTLSPFSRWSGWSTLNMSSSSPVTRRRLGEATEVDEADRLEWVPLSPVSN